MTPHLTLEALLAEARTFADVESGHFEPALYGVTDGKAIGTYLEQKFRIYLKGRYVFTEGNSAQGIDFPGLDVDMKVTSIRQPQSSCPYKSARQKIFGLGYSLLVFVYLKTDDPAGSTGRLEIKHTVFVDKARTADFQTTTGLVGIIENEGNKDDILAFFQERLLPVDDVQASEIANELLVQAPEIGYLTISNALQWRLQYSRVIEKAGHIEGIQRLK
jgi:hypothetical protein